MSARAARWNTLSTPAMALAIAAGSATSAATTSSLGLSLCWTRLRGLPTSMLSTTRTERPRLSRRSVRWEPMKPAPPVTRSSIWPTFFGVEGGSFEEDEAPVSLVSALFVDPFPVLDVVEGFAGELPVQEVHALAFVAPGFDH